MIIDDTYNSSPFACEGAVKTLGEVRAKNRKIAVLGDMLELGKHTVEAHEKVGRLAKDNCDILIVVGQRAQAIKSGAIDAGMDPNNILEFKDAADAGEFMKTFVKKNDFILVKGSQKMRLERVVEAIILDKENKNKILVRQDDAWLGKK